MKVIAGYGPLAIGALVVFAGGCTADPRPLPVVPERPPAGAAGPGGAPASGDFSYQGAAGPERWASLKEEWRPCGEPGQSPVDLPLDALTPGKLAAPAPVAGTAAVKGALSGASIAPRFASLLLEASSNGQAVRLGGDIQQGLVIDTRLAPLESIELHVPAEHKLGGTQQDLELVLWVKDATLGALALSLLFRQGAENAALAPLATTLPPSGSYERKLLKTTLPLQQLVPAGQTLLSYEGSLTVPPCTKGVKRLVLAKVGEVSPAQLELFRKALSNNARPTQPLGDRTVSAVSLVASSTASASAPDSGSAKKNPAPAPAPASKKSP